MRLNPDALADADLAAAPATHEPSVFGDIPRFVWIGYLSAWALLFGLFLAFFATDVPAALAVLTSTFFAFMLLGLPAALGAQAERVPRPPALIPPRPMRNPARTPRAAIMAKSPLNSATRCPISPRRTPRQRRPSATATERSPARRRCSISL